MSSTTFATARSSLSVIMETVSFMATRLLRNHLEREQAGPERGDDALDRIAVFR